MKQKFHPFSRRLMRRIIIVMLITMAITSFLIFLFSASGTVTMLKDHYGDVLNMASERTAGMIRVVEISSVNNIDEISKHLSDPDQVAASLESELRLNPHIVGCGIGFIPDYYPQKGHWFEPYVTRLKDGTIEVKQIGSKSHDYLNQEWFQKGMVSKDGYWSEPYFDESGAVGMICTYCLPVTDADGNVVGAFGADMSLSWLTDRIQEVTLKSEQFGFTGSSQEFDNLAYSFILSGKGDYIVHPDPARILHDNYFNHNGGKNNDKYIQIGQDMMEGKSDVKIADFDGIRSYVFYAPLHNTGWSMGIVVPFENIWGPGKVLGLIILLLLALGLLAAFFLIRNAIRRTSKPLMHLARSAEQVAQGHFDTPLPELRYYDEIHQLRDSFEHMQHALANYIDELKDATAQQASIEQELDIARKIQMAMLPADFSPEQGRDDIDISGRLTPAKAVGGDIYDYFIKDDKLFFCIGDVSGKGVPASLVMSITGAMFRTLANSNDSPAAIMKELNDNMSKRNQSMMFVTLFIGILDIANGELSYCNAGHNAPVIVGSVVRVLDVKPNIAIGISQGWEYVQQTTTLNPGSSLLLYTDGLTEAENQSHELFGIERLLKAAEGASDCQSATAIIDEISAVVHTFVAGAEQSDDLTMLVIRR
ncbi:MAG: SpoIIE family protein phosphatase [Bacteroidales bacterium]|nr:SpoIIE family protein phosphatase [Bacteroidales bacterium]